MLEEERKIAYEEMEKAKKFAEKCKNKYSSMITLPILIDEMNDMYQTDFIIEIYNKINHEETKKIVILGNPAEGKTELARRIRKLFPHIEVLDGGGIDNIRKDQIIHVNRNNWRVQV